MNEPLKYIIFEAGSLPLAVVFNPILNHSDIAIGVQKRNGYKILSAGFCHLHDSLNPTASAWGKSETLGIESRGQIDADILTQFKPQ